MGDFWTHLQVASMLLPDEEIHRPGRLTVLLFVVLFSKLLKAGNWKYNHLIISILTNCGFSSNYTLWSRGGRILLINDRLRDNVRIEMKRLLF